MKFVVRCYDHGVDVEGSPTVDSSAEGLSIDTSEMHCGDWAEDDQCQQSWRVVYKDNGPKIALFAKVCGEWRYECMLVDGDDLEAFADHVADQSKNGWSDYRAVDLETHAFL